MILKAPASVDGTKDPGKIRATFKLGVCLWAQQKYDVALTAVDQAARNARETLGPDHSDTKEFERFITALRVK